MTHKSIKSSRVFTFVLLHFCLLFFSLSGVCSKTAGLSQTFSFKFFLFYFLVICILGVYAVFWQQILKRIPLTTAFCNKAVTIIWGMIWGALIFKEQIKLSMIIGAVIVIAGVILVVTADE